MGFSPGENHNIIWVPFHVFPLSASEWPASIGFGHLGKGVTITNGYKLGRKAKKPGPEHTWVMIAVLLLIGCLSLDS